MGLQSKLEERHGTDPTDIDTSDAFDGPNLDLPLKPGEYLVEIQPDHTEDTETQSGGAMLKLDLQVLGPESKDRRFFPKFIYDCPSNRSFEKEEQDRIQAFYEAAGGDGIPDADDLIGRRLIVETGLEENTYQGETEYRPTIWGVSPESEGPPRGAWPEADQPDLWQKAKDRAKSGDSDDDGDAADSDGSEKSFDEDSIPF